ncbi:glutathionylspermidine synthase family protein [Zavarzinella formosa]|uniref:glutathionylspermidine synthase family protein n=1 Tax=Zavarzinella formosa TaxID=360055 RepID=UPI0002F7974D|nr:glutathionylspermidine synthase family protein [Zavarzinella formosa]
MHRLVMDPRPGWQKRVEEVGLHFHTLRGEPYWDETASYQLSSFEVDQLELAANTLHEMCLNLVQEVIDQRMFGIFMIPKEAEEYVIRSWEEQEPSIYGRFDLAYDGVSPPKLLEYNADTPTALLEASIVQWKWLKDVDERGDQFNSIHERLIEAWQALKDYDAGPIHFAALSGIPEDYITVEYLRDTAIQAGFETDYLDVEDIGWDKAQKQFVDRAGKPIHRLFKLYPWEWLLREEFADHVRTSPTKWVEPAWKAILSCKSILPLLYERYPDSPFLLPASFRELQGNYVRKPVHGREGANISVIMNGQTRQVTDGIYSDSPSVYQALAPMKAYDGRYPVCGVWVVNGVACGLGIREDETIITQNTSRFVPHQMVD